MLLFAEKKSESHSYQLRGIWIGKLLCYGGLDDGFIFQWWEEYHFIDTGTHD